MTKQQVKKVKATQKNDASTALRGAKTTLSQQLAMLEWLEEEINFKWITGDTAKGPAVVLTKRGPSKVAAFNSLAVAVNQKNGSEWTSKVAAVRYRVWIKKYRQQRAAFESVQEEKFCLTVEELSIGLTLDAKKEKIFRYFKRLDNLFGVRQNYNPTHLRFRKY